MLIPHENWLIVGGAGYIGAHIADKFLAEGTNVVIYDSLYSGRESRIDYLRKMHQKEVPLVVGDIRDTSKIEEVLGYYNLKGIIHAAALKSVTESIQNEKEYMEVNFQSTQILLGLAKKYRIRNFVFSSSAAVYGSPTNRNPAREKDPTVPISPYGRSKLFAEEAVTEFLADSENHGTSLRFFNVIGSASPELEDNSAENLLPIVINNVRNNLPTEIFGTDYPTQDGTCVRDYVDVRDVANANFAIKNTKSSIPAILNIGTGKGVSVREMIELVSKVANLPKIDVIESGRRTGDPAYLLADVSLAELTLGFKTNYGPMESVRSLF